MENSKKFYIATYGCQMNVHESEKLAGVLIDRGYTQVQDEKMADVIVFNTCCIRESAEQKIMGNIGAVKPLKKLRKDIVVAVCGCMTQQANMATQLRQKFPFIDIIFGANNIEYFGDYLDTYFAQQKFQNSVVYNKDYMEKGGNLTITRDNKLHAFVNIIYGCNNFCTYCIVPFVRGRERSRDPEEIYKEVKNLIAMGYKVITLLGQNVNSYGLDSGGKGVTFAKLLDTIAHFEGDFELRFMSPHPKDFNDDVIDVIASNDKISKYIHMPAQSGSNKILKAMNRNYTREKYLDIVDKIRTKIPNIILSTDIIVGFPNESEQDFQDTVDLIKRVRYANAFIFIFSKRKGTVAEKMENQIPLDEKRKRIHELLEIEHKISEEIFKNMIGQTTRVLVEEEKSTFFVTKTQCGKVARIMKKDCQNIKLATFMNVEILDYLGGNLIAKPC